MNPPYGREISKWIRKASTSSALVVCLVPARTDTSWWHEYVIPKAKSIEFVRGRLHFNGSLGRAPFASVVVIFDNREQTSLDD